MAKYNNEAFKVLIQTIVNDAFYVDGLSFDAKIAQIRRYTEIILRRLLGYSSNEHVTVGDHDVIKKLKMSGYSEDFFHDNLRIIARSGNKRTHTQKLKVAEQTDFEQSLQALINLYGYLFYRFFKKYPFGQNSSIVRAFSILPPIIREIALSLLYEDNPQDINIIDRLVLAKMKAYDFETAEEWLNKHQNELKKISLQMSEEEQDKLVNKFGHPLADIIIMNEEKSIYSIAVEKVTAFRNAKYTALYTSFEEAVDYYKQNGIVNGKSEEINEFNDLMEFVYIGRHKMIQEQ